MAGQDDVVARRIIWVAATVPDANQYVWIVHYNGEGTFNEAVDRYYADPRRDALDFNPRDYLVEADLRMMETI